jgi:integrase
LTDPELRTIWNGADKVPIYGAMIQLAMLTGQRRGELASLKFSDIDFATKEWHLKGAATKNEAPHVVHLSDAALRIIESAKRFEGCAYVFTTNGRSPISGFSKYKKTLDNGCTNLRLDHP